VTPMPTQDLVRPDYAETAFRAWKKSKSARRETVHIPTTGSFASGVTVQIPTSELYARSAFGAVLVNAIPRTQGLHVDRYRVVLLALAQSFGSVWTADEPTVSTAETLATSVDRIRKLSGLPASDVARMAGIQRRHLYNLVDGGNTTPEREHRIRSLAGTIDELYARLNDVDAVRSSLLAPVGADLRSFVDMAAEGEPIGHASRMLMEYLSRRNYVPRKYIQTPRKARAQERAAAEAVKDTRDIAPDQR